MLKKDQWPIAIFALLMLIVYGMIFFSRKNYEFIGYIVVVVFFAALIVFTNDKVKFPNFVLWWLAIWAFLHLSGGGISSGGWRLYDWIIVDIVGEPYLIFKYDQFVHIIGFFAATLAMYYLIKPKLKPDHKWAALGIVVVMAGLGAGALNEIIEFTATVMVPSTGVGGYENTSLDLVSDMIGALIAFFYIKYKEKPKISAK
ncbi:DUF2238 domain-containing protein [Candidatus Woesearchaeota archaeon]|nr:DUF2238 domain-containing protein [Candidatus Woesearchaeota archaeon]